MTQRQDYKTVAPEAYAAILGVETYVKNPASKSRCWSSSGPERPRSTVVHIASICIRKMRARQVKRSSAFIPYPLGARPVWSKYWSEACPYSKLRKLKKSWSFAGIQSFE